MPRIGQVASDVKGLEQDARGALRKHGIRFGQFTIFMPLLLKPAPTRLRLVLWSLQNGLQEFPEAPPPGLVTVPTPQGAPEGYAAMSGYREAGERSIRIDMLERLADQLRSEDSRGGFEATADMLSITGMTLEQFADLMQGLGYKADKGERIKLRAPKADAEAAKEEAPAEASEADGGTVEESAAPAVEGSTEPVQTEPAVTEERSSEGADDTEVPAEEVAIVEGDEGPEMEVFYTFTWAPRRQGGGNRQRSAGGRRDGAQEGSGRRHSGSEGNRGSKRDKDQGKGRRQGKPGGKGKPHSNQPKKFEARPPKQDKPIDPDNPFAALMALKDKS